MPEMRVQVEALGLTADALCSDQFRAVREVESPRRRVDIEVLLILGGSERASVGAHTNGMLLGHCFLDGRKSFAFCKFFN